jgi:NAD-dependent deacetylase sirtuin 2
MAADPSPSDLAALRPPPVDGLPSLTLEGIAEYIKSGRGRRIVLACGAGISSAAGIPDFRSPGVGLYFNLQKYNLPYPRSIFDITYFPDHPEAFFSLVSTMLTKQFRPTLIHYFIALLHRKGLLLRVFTQNIDMLEREAGLPGEFLVEAHGTFFTAHCLRCRRAYTLAEIRSDLETGNVLRCRTPGCGGLVKPDVVFFGEDLPPRFTECSNSDLPAADLLIVMGTSLGVMPFAGIVPAVRGDIPRLLINQEAVGVAGEKPAIVGGVLTDLEADDRRFKFGKVTNRRDVFAGGDCQETVAKLVRLLGWETELSAMLPREIAIAHGFATPEFSELEK